MTIAHKNAVLIVSVWALWMALVATEVLVHPYEWLKSAFFIPGAVLLVGSVALNVEAFPSVRSEALRTASGVALGLTIAIVAGLLGIAIAVNFKFLLGGSL